MGSYLVHSPPGDLKSGMPDSVEMPAPVRAITISASFISRAACSISSLTRTPAPPRQCSGTLGKTSLKALVADSDLVYHNGFRQYIEFRRTRTAAVGRGKSARGPGQP